jgi:hypothetical protein
MELETASLALEYHSYMAAANCKYCVMQYELLVRYT